MTVAALVLAAGRGERLGQGLPKAFVPLLGKPLLLRSLETLAAAPEIEQVLPVLNATDMRRYASLDLVPIPKLLAPVAGGAERQDSVREGLAALPGSVDFVVIHDAARCLVRVEDVRRVIAGAEAGGAAVLARRVGDTIKRVRDGRVIDTPDRSECWAAQTPQVFRLELLREALAKADAEGVQGTDDAQLVERLGAPVHVVEGSASNFKITWPADLAAAEAILQARESEGTGV